MIVDAALNIPNDDDEECMDEEENNNVYMKEFTPEEEATLKNILYLDTCPARTWCQEYFHF